MKFNEYEDLTPASKPIFEEPEEKIVEEEGHEQISNEASFDSKKLTNASTLHEQISEANSGVEIKSEITFDDQMSTHKLEVVEPSVMSVESPKAKVEEAQPKIYFGEQNLITEETLPQFVPDTESRFETVQYAEPEVCIQYYQETADVLGSRPSRYSAPAAHHAQLSQDFGLSISQKRCDFA